MQKLGRFDQIVEYAKGSQCPDWLDATAFSALPDTILVRELRYRTPVVGFRTREVTLVTTLLDADAYSSAALAALYRRRWEIETNFAHLKTTMKLDVLKCKTVEGVLKELVMFALVYNLVRLAMVRAAAAMRTPPQRVSFVDALRWLAEACRRTPTLLLQINPDRSNRLEPRARKRRPKEFPLMKATRRQLRQKLLQKRLTP